MNWKCAMFGVGAYYIGLLWGYLAHRRGWWKSRAAERELER